MKKRMLSLMLAVLMVVCLLPTTALAATLVWPVPGHKSLSQGFYYNNANEYHYGIDISDGSITGATIVAAMGGTVKYVRNCTQQHPGSQHNCYGFGTGVVIIGDDGRAYQYAHMQGGSVPSNVYVGARVEAGQMIGRVGQTGDATGPHLHFGISNGQNYWENNVNPMLETYADGPSVGVEWINEQIQTWDTNCYVYSRATTSVKGTFSSGGITLWDSKGNVVATRDDSVNWTGTYLNVGYNITEEIGVTLTPGTAYKYQLRAVFNGKTYTKEGTVTTTGQAPHTHYYTATVTAPTCTAKGYTTHTCACGNSYVDTYTDALGHAWDNGKVTKQPTEAETGVKTFTCTRCGETKMDGALTADADKECALCCFHGSVLLSGNGALRADLRADRAADALVRIDVGLLVADGDGRAGNLQAALAADAFLFVHHALANVVLDALDEDRKSVV